MLSKVLLYILVSIGFSVLGGSFIGNAVSDCKKGEWYSFGVNVMLALSLIFTLAAYCFKTF